MQELLVRVRLRFSSCCRSRPPLRLKAGTRARLPALPALPRFASTTSDSSIKGTDRGAQPEGRDYADLAALGIKTVINLTSDDAQTNEGSMVERANMTYVEIPMTTHEPPTAVQLAQFLGIVNDPANQPVYVHCVGGRHRTGVMTAVYRMTADSWTPDQAFKEMKQYEFGADFLHPEFKQFVYGYRAESAAATLSSPVVAIPTKVQG